MVDERRRSLLNLLVGGSFAAWMASIFFPVFTYLWPKRREEAALTDIMVGKADEFEPDSGKIVKFGYKPAIVLKTADGDFRAFIAICTHLDCTVQYRKDMGLIWCACHNGRYDLTGKNVAGPPPRPLTPLKVVLKEDQVFITSA